MRPHRSHILALFGQSLLACAVDPHAWQVRSIGQRDARCPAREEGKQEAVGEHAHGFSDDRRRRCARVSPRSHGHLSIISSSHHHIITSSHHLIISSPRHRRHDCPHTRLEAVVANAAAAAVGRSTHAHHPAAAKAPPAAHGPASAAHGPTAAAPPTTPSATPSGVHLDHVVERSIDLRDADTARHEFVHHTHQITGAPTASPASNIPGHRARPPPHEHWSPPPPFLTNHARAPPTTSSTHAAAGSPRLRAPGPALVSLPEDW